jgi:hypothetical protein
MTGQPQLARSPKDRFLDAAKQELIAFEKKEREFRRKEKRERAAELKIPADKITELHS